MTAKNYALTSESLMDRLNGTEWLEIASVMDAEFGTASAFIDYFHVAPHLYLLADNGLYHTTENSTSPLEQKQTFQKGDLLRHVAGISGGKGIGVFTSADSWEYEMDFTSGQEGFVGVDFGDNPFPPYAVYTSGVGWSSITRPSTTRSLQMERSLPPGIYSEVSMYFSPTPIGTISYFFVDTDTEPLGTIRGSLPGRYVFLSDDGTSHMLADGSPAIGGYYPYAEYLSGQRLMVTYTDGADPRTDLSISKIILRGYGTNPFTSASHDAKFIFSSNAGTSITTTSIGQYTGDKGGDVDDFNLGIVIGAAEGTLQYSTSYTGSFSPLSGLSGINPYRAKINYVHIPRYKLATQALNKDVNSFQVIYATDLPVSGKTLWAVTFDAENGEVDTEVDITPIIGGTTYKIVGPNALDIYNGDSNYILAFAQPISSEEGEDIVLIGSGDGATTWTLRNDTFNGTSVQFLKIGKSGDGHRAWVAGADGVAYTKDGGESFVYQDGHEANEWLPEATYLKADGSQLSAITIPDNPPGTCAVPPWNPVGGNPIRLRNGNKEQSFTDLRLQTPSNELAFTRTYNQEMLGDADFQFMGLGWTHNHFSKLILTGSSPNREAEVLLPGGTTLKLAEDSGTAGTFYALVGSTSTLVFEDLGANDVYVLTVEDKSSYIFDAASLQLKSRHWPNNESWAYSYNGSAQLIEVADDYANNLQFSYIDNSGQFDHELLWRVGDHTAAALGSGSPTGRYVEFSYSPEKSNGSTVGGAKGLLTHVQDVREEIWTYRYYGAESGESTAAKLNFLLERLSPEVDTDGDGDADPELSLESLDYTLAGSQITEIVQERGEGLIETTYVFPQGSSVDTTETTAGKTTIHRFADDDGSPGVYLGAVNPADEGAEQRLNLDYRLHTQTDARGNDTLLDWSEGGQNLTRVIDAEGNISHFEYDSEDRLISDLDAEGHKRTYAYDDMDNSRLATEVKVFSDATETEVLEWRAFAYDAKGRTLLEQQIDPADGTTVLRETERAYYPDDTDGSGNHIAGAGLLETVTRKDMTASTPNDVSTDYFYDQVGHVVQINQNSNFGSCQRTRTVYDAAGNGVASICNYDPGSDPHPTDVTEAVALYDEGTPEINRVTVHEYDALGRRIKTTVNAGASFEQTSLTVYDALDRVIRSIQNFDGTGVTSPYTAARSAFDHGTDNTKNLITDTFYNERGLVRKSVDVLGNATLYGYDDADRLVKTMGSASDPDYDNSYAGDPDLSAYVVGSNPDEDIITTSSYDANGNLVKSIDAQGRVSLTGYDVLNRVVKTVQAASQPTYDWVADPTLSAYSASGEADQDLITTNTFDALGRIRQTVDVAGNVTLYGYDDLGRQVRTIRAAGQPTYDWATDPSLSAYPVTEAVDQDIVSSTTYDSQGRTLYTEDVLGSRTWVAYDGLGRQVKTIASAVGTATDDGTEDPRSSSYDVSSAADEDLITQTHYDVEGRVKWTRDILGRYTLFGYDDLNRQVRVIRNASDPNYNTVSDPDLSGYTPSSEPDEDQLTQAIYDDQGRVWKTIDPRGNETRHTYDVLGRRIQTVQNYVNGVYSALVPDEDLITQTEYDLAGRVVSTVDPGGRETHYEYDALGRRIKTIQNYVDGVFNAASPDEDLITETAYNRAGQVISTTDARGTKTTFSYDRAGRRVSTTLAAETPLAATSKVIYEKSGRVFKRIDALGATTTNFYDRLGRITQTFDPNDVSPRNFYAKDGRVTLVTDPYGVPTAYAYDKLRRRTHTIHFPTWDVPTATPSASGGSSAGNAFDGNTGTFWQSDDSLPAWFALDFGTAYTVRQVQLLTGSAAGAFERAPRDFTVQYYDGDSWEIALSVSDLIWYQGEIKTFVIPDTYSAEAWRIYITATNDPDSDIVELGEVTMLNIAPVDYWAWNDDEWQDGFGLPILLSAKDRNNITLTGYDKAGRRTSQRDPNGHLTTYTYDDLDRRLTLTNPLSQTWTTEYTNLSGGEAQVTLTDPMTFATERTFDRAGRLKEITYGHSSTPDVFFTYDALGNRLSMREEDSTLVRETFYTYDDARRLIQVEFDEDGNGVYDQAVAYEYDAGGLRTKLTLPGNLDVIYQYDARGRLIALTDWDGQTTTHSYDRASRVTQTVRPNALSTRYRYDVNSRLVDLHHLAAGETAQRYRYTVDGVGRRTRVMEISAGEDGPYTETFTPNHTAIQYPRGTWTQNGDFRESENRDARLRLTFFGQELDLTLGTGPDNGIVDIYIDQNFWGSHDTYASSADEVTLTLPCYEDTEHVLILKNRGAHHPSSMGWLMQFKEAVATSYLAIQTLQHTYDTLSRLIGSSYYEGMTATGTPVRQYQYGYDHASNRTAQKLWLEGVLDTDLTYTYNAANQLTTDGTNTFTYDANGNRTSDGTNSYTWDRANRLLSFVGIDYAYNGLGQRVSQTSVAGITKYLLDAQPGLAQILQSTLNTDVTRFVPGLAQQNPDDAWLWFAQDGLGTVRGIYDESLNLIESRTPNPWGELVEGAVSESPFYYTNMPFDANGLSYHNARYYDPITGNWVSKDPLETSNRYGYVGGNVTNMIDPSGLQDTCPMGPAAPIVAPYPLLRTSQFSIFGPALTSQPFNYRDPSLWQNQSLGRLQLHGGNYLGLSILSEENQFIEIYMPPQLDGYNSPSQYFFQDQNGWRTIWRSDTLPVKYGSFGQNTSFLKQVVDSPGIWVPGMRTDGWMLAQIDQTASGRYCAKYWAGAEALDNAYAFIDSTNTFTGNPAGIYPSISSSVPNTSQAPSDTESSPIYEEYGTDISRRREIGSKVAAGIGIVTDYVLLGAYIYARDRALAGNWGNYDGLIQAIVQQSTANMTSKPEYRAVIRSFQFLTHVNENNRGDLISRNYFIPAFVSAYGFSGQRLTPEQIVAVDGNISLNGDTLCI
jgi:RHS repeat-associated protein